MNQAIYRDFLTELKGLDDFLARRAGDGLVQQTDPDVRRLMEAMAYFSARTRRAAMDGVRGAVHRLARGYLDSLLWPQPARGLVQAVPGERLIEPVHVPRGAGVRIVNADGEVGLFRTMHGATLLPLGIERVAVRLRPGQGMRVLIGLRARGVMRALPAPLALHIDYMHDYLSSLRFHHGLREHLEAASVFYDEDPDATAPGLPCQTGFGCPAESDEAVNPLDRIRAFFHFPEKELYFNVQLPAPPRPWRRAWLCLDLAADWPEDLAVNQDVFRLFVIPVENLRQDLADPILADGTRASHAIRNAVAPDALALHSVAGVYQEVASGLEPMLPAHLASTRECYEIELVEGESGEPESRLLLRLPGAFLAPRKITVEALWHQPWFDAAATGKLDVSLQTRRIEGVTWQMRGRLTPHRDSTLWQDAFDMLHVLALRSRRSLARNEMMYLMEVLGADRDGYHAEVVDMVTRVSAHEVPATGREGGGVKQVYRAVLRDAAPEQRGLVFDFMARLWMLLDAWSVSPVELEMVRQARRAGNLLTEGRWA